MGNRHIYIYEVFSFVPFKAALKGYHGHQKGKL